MDTDLSSQLHAARSTSIQLAVSVAALKKSLEMEMTLAEVVDQVARSAPPPDQGTRVDKLA
jgi:hypothetical protein